MDKILVNNSSLVQLVEDEIRTKGPTANLNHINVSKVTDMNRLFCDSKFNGDISEWDVSGVEDMGGMFLRSNFNGDISMWDVSNVYTM